jgi:hypothetical protein
MKLAISIAAMLGSAMLPAAAFAGGVAGPPPPALISVHAIGATPQDLNSYGTLTGSSCDPLGCQVGGQFSRASATAAPAVSVLGLSTYPSVVNFPTSLAAVSVTYYYEVIGPAKPVPLTITGSVSASAGGLATAYASIIGTDFSGVVACSCAAAPGAATLDQSFSVTPGAVSAVTLFAAGQEGGNDTGPGVGSYSASADPMITIDPAFLAQNPGYSLVFSPNLAVPEPATWALMLIGVGGLGAAMRGSRRSLTAAAA